MHPVQCYVLGCTEWQNIGDAGPNDQTATTAQQDSEGVEYPPIRPLISRASNGPTFPGSQHHRPVSFEYKGVRGYGWKFRCQGARDILYARREVNNPRDSSRTLHKDRGLFSRWRLGHISTSSQKRVISRLTIVMRFVGLGRIGRSNGNGKERLFACQANAVVSANMMSMRH